MNLDNNFKKKFGDDLRLNVQLADYSWFNLGGNAEYFYKAKNISQLIEFLRELQKKKNLKTIIVGAGSNILFRDNGVKGAVIKLGKEFSFIKKLKKDTLEIGAATLGPQTLLILQRKIE